MPVPLPKSALLEALQSLTAKSNKLYQPNALRNELARKGVKPEELKYSGIDEQLTTAQKVADSPETGLGPSAVSPQTLSNTAYTETQGFGSVANSKFNNVTPTTSTLQDYQVNIRTFGDKQVDSHFDTPGYIFHSRSSRESINGEEVLKVHEIQSDLHQKRRAAGVGPGESIAGRPELPFAKTWPAKALEQEVLRAEQLGLKKIAVDLFNPDPQLMRGEGARTFYETTVRNTMKKLAKKLGGTYEEVSSKKGAIDVLVPDKRALELIKQDAASLAPVLKFEGISGEKAVTELLSMPDNMIFNTLDAAAKSEPKLADKLVELGIAKRGKDFGVTVPRNFNEKDNFERLVKTLAERNNIALPGVLNKEPIINSIMIKSRALGMLPKEFKTKITDMLKERDELTLPSEYADFNLRVSTKIDTFLDSLSSKEAQDMFGDVGRFYSVDYNKAVTKLSTKLDIEKDFPELIGEAPDLVKDRAYIARLQTNPETLSKEEKFNILDKIKTNKLRLSSETINNLLNAKVVTRKNLPKAKYIKALEENPELLADANVAKLIDKTGELLKDEVPKAFKPGKPTAGVVDLPEGNAYLDKIKLFSAGGAATLASATAPEDTQAAEQKTGVIKLPEGTQHLEKMLRLEAGTQAPIDDSELSKPNPVLKALADGASVQSITDYLENEEMLEPDEARAFIVNSLKARVEKARAGDASDENIKLHMEQGLGIPEDIIAEVMGDKPRTGLSEGPAITSQKQEEFNPEAARASWEQYYVPVNAEKKATEETTARLASLADNVHSKYMPLIDSIKGYVFNNNEARASAEEAASELKISVANSLRDLGRNVVINEFGELVEITDKGEEVVDDSILQSMLDSSYEIGGAIAGGAITAKAMNELLQNVTPGGKLAKFTKGLAITAATTLGVSFGDAAGRGLDTIRNAFKLQEQLDLDLVMANMYDAGVATETFELVGGPLLAIGLGATKTIAKAFKAIVDGNSSGAYNALKADMNLNDQQVDELIALWESHTGKTAPGLTRSTKALTVLPQTQPGGEAMVAGATSLSPKASTTIARSIDVRAKDLNRAAENLTTKNIGTIVHDELNKYVKDVKETYGAVKELGISLFDDAKYTFNYDKLTVEPTLNILEKRITNPAVKKRFLAYAERIRDIGGFYANDGPKRLRGFKDLLDLRATLNDFKYNVRIKNATDYELINKSIKNVDREIAMAATKNIPNSRAWLREWRKANTEYSKMKVLDKNVLYRALTTKGVDQAKVIKSLTARIESLDGTFMSVMGKLPERVRPKVEGAVFDTLVKKYTIGDASGLQATHFPMLAKVLQQVAFTTPEARTLKRAVVEVSKVFKNDINLGRVTGKIVVPSFKSYLTTDIVVRAKFEIASQLFNYIRRLAPTSMGDNIALITKLGKVLENPLDSKEVNSIAKELGNDPELLSSLRQLSIAYAKRGEKETYPKVPLYRLGERGRAHKTVDGKLGKGTYWNTIKPSRKPGHKIYSEEVLPRRIANPQDVAEALNIPVEDLTAAQIKGNDKLLFELQNRGFDGISMEDTVLIFKE